MFIQAATRLVGRGKSKTRGPLDGRKGNRATRGQSINGCVFLGDLQDGDFPIKMSRYPQKQDRPKWLRLSTNRYPKWGGKRKHGLKSAVPWWLNFNPQPLNVSNKVALKGLPSGSVPLRLKEALLAAPAAQSLDHSLKGYIPRRALLRRPQGLAMDWVENPATPSSWLVF